MRFVESGRLELDVPVKRYISWLELRDKRAEQTITLRHLLSHRSGLPAEYTPEGPRDEGLLKASLIEGLRDIELDYPTGEGYKYSNWGFRLISAVLEELTGERYSELAMREVVLPLGMSSSFFIRPGDALPGIAMPHSRDESGELVREPYIKENYCRMAAGGLYSSAEDLVKLGRMLLRGGLSDGGERIISPEMLSLMKAEATLLPSGDGYGLALQEHRFGEIRAIGHYGSAPPYSSALYADEASGYAVAVMLNTPSNDLRRVITELVLTELGGK